MTHEEIEAYRQRLVNIQNIKDPGKRNEAIIELRKAVGASYCGRDLGSTGVRDAENIAAIHQALQTASMIVACQERRSRGRGWFAQLRVPSEGKKPAATGLC